jgi:hypothetical protein
MVNYVKLDQSAFTSDDVVCRFWDFEDLGIRIDRIKH